MNLKNNIQSVIQQYDASFGIYIKNLTSNEEIEINSDKLFQMASVVKVPILVTLYKEVYEENIHLNDRVVLKENDLVGGSGVFKEMEFGIKPTIKDLATMMIIISDNLATDAILKQVTVNEVQSYMEELGLKDLFVKQSIWELLTLSVGLDIKPYSQETYTQIEEKLHNLQLDKDSTVYSDDPNNNISSAKSMSLLMEKIYKGKIISETCSKEILTILFKQQYQQRIGGKLPKPTKVANKTGSLGTVFNDSGIVYLPNDEGAFVITVYSNGHTYDFDGNDAISTISRLAYDYFTNKS